MRIVLSRKGFDSGYGCIPSPILPDGRPFSMPIPSCEWPPYAKVKGAERILRDLGNSKSPLDWEGCHLDPDLDREVLPRASGWLPSFGQVGASLTHLRNMGVREGDLFLFFGWFRRTEDVGGRLRYVGPDMHCLYGWIQIGSILTVGADASSALADFPWLVGHPHANGLRGRDNTIFVAAEFLDVPGVPLGLPGGGVFKKSLDCHRLSADGCTRSVWRLPKFFRNAGLSYHGSEARWADVEDWCILKSVAKGQEFVSDVTRHEDEAGKWLSALFENEKGRA